MQDRATEADEQVTQAELATLQRVQLLTSRKYEVVHEVAWVALLQVTQPVATLEQVRHCDVLK